MRLVAVHMRAGTVELLRYPAFSVPTLGFPALLFLLIASSAPAKDAEELMAGFGAVAFLGVVLFQFGVGIAAERASPWEAFLRVLPVSTTTRLVARVLSALAFACVSCAAVLTCAVAATAVALPATAWAGLLVALIAGSTPFALLGISVGYWVRPRAALPVANLLFLPLSYAGGLWGGPRSLPGWLDGVSPYLPTRQWGNWIWRALDGDLWQPRAIGLLAAYGALFAGLAALGYRRDEGERFR